VYRTLGRVPEASQGAYCSLYTFGTTGSLFQEAVPTNRPVALMSQQELAAALQRHGSETVGRPPF